MPEGYNKIGSIIILRGIAALAVCIVHIALLTNIHINKTADTLISLGQQGVAIFFVISGFILPYSLSKKEYQLKKFFAFLIRRSIRIDPPYWFTIVILFITRTVALESLNLNTILLHIFYLVPFVNNANWYCDIFWTLSIEFQFYIVIGLLYPILNRINTNFSILFLVLTSAVFILLNFNHRGVILTNFYDFVMGYLVFLSYIKQISQNKTLVILGAYTIFIMFTVSFITGLVPLLTALFIIFYKKNTIPGYLTFNGKISYSLYLLHIPVSYFFLEIIKNIVTNKFLLFPLCLFISIISAYIFNIVIEKPSIKLSKAIKFNPLLPCSTY